MRIAFEGARKRLKTAAERRKKNNDCKVRDACLGEGQSVWLRDFSARGRHKIQDLWGPAVYKVLRVPEVGGSVYTVAPLQDLSKIKRVNRSQLKAAVGVNLREDTAAAPSPPSRDQSSVDELLREDGLWGLVQEPARVTGLETAAMAATTPPHFTGFELSSPTPGPSTAPAAVIADLPLVHNVPPIPDPAISTSLVRRSVRSTAGQHSNVHHLPRPVGEPAHWAVGFPAPTLNPVSA